LQKENDIEKQSMGIPEAKVEKADGSIVEKMKQHGLVVLPIAQNSNWLKVNFVADTLINNEDLEWLLALQKQLIWLKLGHTNLNDTNMAVIAHLKNLTWLSLEFTKITDKGLEAIQSMQNLQYLNLVGTRVTANGVLKLKNLKFLRSLYLFQTNINKIEWTELQKAFPKTIIDSGGYSVPLLKTDTIVVKVKKEY